MKKPEQQSSGNNLEFTGERFVTSIPKTSQIAYEHLHRYFVASEIVAGLRVLDIACGEGYGTHLLARRAKTVLGVDIAEQAIQHAKSKYKRRNVQFETGDCTAIPAMDGSLDAVVSFETIEHVADPAAFVSEIQRVLTGDGILIISSPNRTVYTDRLGNDNPFHVSELYHEQFLELLTSAFRHVAVAQQRLIAGSYIALSDSQANAAYGTFAGDYRTSKFQEGVSDAPYVVAVCSNVSLPKLKLGAYETFIESARIWDSWEKSAALREKCQGLESNAAAHQQLLLEKQRELEITEVKLSEIQASLTAVRETSVDWTRTMEAAQAEFNRTSQQLQDQLRNAIDEGNKSKNNEAALIERLQQSDLHLAAAQQARDAATEKTNLLAKSLEQAENRLRVAEEKVVHLRTQRETLDGEMEALRQKIASLLEDLASWTERALGAEREIKNDRERISSLTAKNHALEENLVQSEKSRQAERALSAAAYGRFEDLLKASQEELNDVLTQVEKSAEKSREIEEQLAIREQKLIRMQQSISWKLTAPLRAMRRTFIDRFRSR